MPQFVKGRSGNPGGRPKDAPAKLDLLAEIRRQLSSVDPESRLSKGSELVQALITAGCGGDVRACQEILNRVHGRVEARMETARFEKHLEVKELFASIDEATARRQAAAEAEAVRVLMAEFPELDGETADKFQRAFREGVRDRGEAAAAEVFSELCRDLGLPGDDEPEPGPEPPPQPEPEPPYRRPEPMIRPKPEPPSEPEPEPDPPPPVVPAHLDPRYVQHGDLWFSIPEQEP